MQNRYVDNVYDIFWHLRNKKHTHIDPENLKKLRLVLGIGRSGTTWIVNTLARTKTPIRCFEEPLHHIRPKINPLAAHDHTCTDSLIQKKRLIESYKILTLKQIPSELRGRFFTRDDNNFEYILTKEVHSLFSCYHVAKETTAPVLFIKRKIATIVDSLFNAQGIKTTYLQDEFNILKNSFFIDNEFKSQKKEIISIIRDINRTKEFKRNKILSTTLTIYLLQNYFNKISNKLSNAIVMDYEDIVKDPNYHFDLISKHFEFKYTTDSYNFKNSKENDPCKDYSISRDSSQLVSRKNKYLSDNDINSIEEFVLKLNVILHL